MSWWLNLTSGFPLTDQTRYLYGLQLADGGAECVAFLCVVRGAVQSSLTDAKCLGRNADSSAVQGLLKNKEREWDCRSHIAENIIPKVWIAFWTVSVTVNQFTEHLAQTYNVFDAHDAPVIQCDKKNLV